MLKSAFVIRYDNSKKKKKKKLFLSSNSMYLLIYTVLGSQTFNL